MSVYVEPLHNWGWKYGPSCHLVADSLSELHEFAGKLGMLRSWFQDKDVPHYDLIASKRKLAVMLGAIELTDEQAVKKWRALRAARDGGCTHIAHHKGHEGSTT